ncbi:MAG: bifunctional DNA primase/polymerase [Puniceicoccales bacterium]|jgi:hypothetical protein|nr:bifunctional DNA primase/polymerase [Puniceicoccales bacterium]
MTPTPPLLRAALEYAARGWHIFPCRKHEKVPATYNGVKAATTDPAQITKWWRTNPNYNIAIACGDASGIYIVDVDCHGKIDGRDTLKQILSTAEIPRTITALTPNNGLHYYFSTDTPPKSKNNYAPGIDIRSNGFYVLAPPSLIARPDGTLIPYTWSPHLAPDTLPLANFPDCFRPPSGVGAAKRSQHYTPAASVSERSEQTPSSPIASSYTPPPASDALAIATRYLATVAPAVQGNGGHSALLWAARALVIGCTLPPAQAEALLLSDYNPRCIPPWDMSDPRDARDFRRKISVAHRTPSEKPPGWILTEHTHSAGDTARLLAIGGAIAANLLRQAPAPQRPIVPLPVSGVQSPVSTPSTQSTQSTPSTDATAPLLPDYILTPPGLIGDICTWLNATALKRQPLFALAAALTFCGALFGRKVRDEWNNRTNLYTISIGESSSGKDHARRRIVALCEAAHIENILGGEDVTSDAALEKRFSERPVTLFLWDEVGHLFASIKQAAQNPHLSKIIPFLMKLYSCAGSMYIGKQYTAADRRTLKQPHCCLYGTTTPDRMTGGMTVDEIRDGWIGRILPFYSQENPSKDYTAARNLDVPASLAAAVAAWAAHTPPPPEGTGDVNAVTNPHQHQLITTPEAQQIFLDFETFSETKMQDHLIKSKGIDRIWGKAGENARKVALILATGDALPDTIATQTIAPIHATIATKIIRQINETFSELIFSSVSESYIEKDKNYLLKLIKQSMPHGLTRSQLTNRTRRFNQRQRNEYLADLSEAGEIIITTITTNSKPEQKIFHNP